MRVNVNMPQLGESVAEGTIVKWLKKVGDPVQRDEDILEISTDKVDSAIPSPATGILVEILAQEGETIGIGKAIAVIETDISQVKAKKNVAPEKAADAEPAAETVQKKEVEQVAYAADAGEVKVVRTTRDGMPGAGKGQPRFYSPLVKKIAQEERIPDAELDAIEGSGAGGRVTKEDLMNYLAKRRKGAPAVEPIKTALPPLEPPPLATVPSKPAIPPVIGQGEEIIPMDNMRRRIAEHMVKSKFTAPHVFSVAEVDMTRVINFREKVKQLFEAREGFKFTITPIIIEASVKALKEFPLVNSSVDGENIILKHYINIGIAVALENGLIVPVIKGADGMNLLALARAANDLSVRARNKRLSPDEVTGSTFSLTNFGVFGNIFGAPIINQPNVAILGIGAVKKRPVVIEGDAIAVRSMLYLSISYDHRIVDGALGDQFLQRIRHYLENFDPDTTL